ncbi:MAG: hypothetical protein H6618_03205 [Deltaproteobacteria bacterium]|nr:hypothetical protein [Deltaproteobacteria bacterium]
MKLTFLKKTSISLLALFCFFAAMNHTIFACQDDGEAIGTIRILPKEPFQEWSCNPYPVNKKQFISLESRLLQCSGYIVTETGKTTMLDIRFNVSHQCLMQEIASMWHFAHQNECLLIIFQNHNSKNRIETGEAIINKNQQHCIPFHGYAIQNIKLDIPSVRDKKEEISNSMRKEEPKDDALQESQDILNFPDGLQPSEDESLSEYSYEQ